MDIFEDMGIMGPLYGTVHRSTFLVGFYCALLGSLMSGFFVTDKITSHYKDMSMTSFLCESHLRLYTLTTGFLLAKNSKYLFSYPNPP